MKFKLLPGRFAICQLAPGSPVPAWAASGDIRSVTVTAEETSIICADSAVPEGVKAQKGFICLEVQGPFTFDAVGIMQSFLQPLAQAGVPVFAMSTFNTDFILVHEERREPALAALRNAGHELLS